MPPTPSTCVTCGKSFAPNRELATIPDATRIAFDPVHRRAWRVCASCDEWNLLGTEASAVALPELEARFDAIVPVTLPELSLAPARISDTLELLRLGSPDGNADAARSALRLRREADARARKLRWMPLVWLLGAAVVLVTFWPVQGDWTVPVMMLMGYSEIAFFTTLSKRIFGERTWRGTLPLSAALALSAFAWLYVYTGWDTLQYSMYGLLVMMPYFFIIDPLIRRHVGLLRFKLGNGRRLRISERALPEISVSWSQGGTDVTLHDLPDGQVLTGPDVAQVYRFVYGGVMSTEGLKAMVRLDAVTKDAYRLLQAAGGLAGLLRSLDGFRRDRDGRVLLADIPFLYRVALDLALSAENATRDDHPELRQRALAAAEVAKEAEALERGEDEDADGIND